MSEGEKRKERRGSESYCLDKSLHSNSLYLCLFTLPMSSSFSRLTSSPLE